MNGPDDRTVSRLPPAERATVSSAPLASAASEGTQVQASAPTHLFEQRAAPPLPVVPGFVVSAEIARGGMGVVYVAHDPTFDREVAIKVMHPGQDAGRFVVESKVTARLPHPGIPPVYALGKLPDGRPFLAMKLVAGRTLSDELKAADRAELPRLLGLFEDICQAVGYAHAQGVIHRDLKPSNVMIGAFGEVLVMDWGLAKELRIADCGLRNEDTPTASSSSDPQSAIHNPQSSETVAGQVKGTPAYMAPEQARGEPVDARADVFALGGILATILTGQPPFWGNTAADTVRLAGGADLSACRARLDTCGADTELLAVAKRCLAPTAADRYADGKAVAEAVAAYRAGVAERLRAAERERAVHEAEAREQRKRRRVQLALAGALFLLVCGGGAFAWHSDRQAEERKRKQIEAAAEAKLQQQAEELRRARNRDTTVALLEQTESALRAGDAERAAGPLAQATKRIDEGGAEDLRTRFDRCRTDLAMLRELDAIAAVRWTFADLNLPKWKVLVPRIAGAFAGYGIGPGVAPPEAARRINDSLVREPLLTYLEIWFVASGRDPAVRALLSAADPDEFRDRARVTSYPETALVWAFRDRPVPVPPIWFAVGHGQDADLPFLVREHLLLTALRERPNSFPLLMTLATLGETVDKESRFRRVAWCRAALAVQPRNVVIWNNLGVAQNDLGDLPGAVKAYQKAIEVDSRNPVAYSNLGNALGKMGRLKEALALYEQALARDPNYAIAHNNSGVTLLEANEIRAAAEAFRAAIKSDGKYALAHHNLGVAMIRLKDWKGAIAAYRGAVACDPDYAAAYNSLGVALRNDGDLPGAEEAHKTAMSKGDNGPGVRTNLSGVYYERKDYPEVIKWAREALAKDPDYANAYVMLGEAHLALGNRNEALAAFKTAARLDRKWWLLPAKVPPLPGAPYPREVSRP
jgi:tetratricopeptide (TPR) repeat protein